MAHERGPSDWDLSITYSPSRYALSVTELSPQRGPGLNGDRRLATAAEARALSSTFRLRILRACLGEPMTNKQIAQRLGRNPATVLHHVRLLVEQGFLAPTAERRGARGAREVPYL
ncbi:MAG: winged helix-turn-helix transcriptional regulator, partial [Geodermatophilaceae bacterium]|nr:winged helix-turn-helix transcriptional regulator [Geodermatophilaceae bacterium]